MPALNAERRGYAMGDNSSSDKESAYNVSHFLNPGILYLKSKPVSPSPGSFGSPAWVARRKPKLRRNVIAVMGKPGPPQISRTEKPNSRLVVGLKLSFPCVTNGWRSRPGPITRVVVVVGRIWTN